LAVALANYIVDEQLVHLGRPRRKSSRERWGRLHFWQLRELAKGRRSFWAVVLLACIQGEAALRRSMCRDADGWMKVSTRLLAGIARPSSKAKRAALAELAAAGIVEVRRCGHQAPKVRLLPQQHEEETS
jgi:hypothetical protein